VRYFDNAYGYGNGAHEAILGKWLAKTNRRSDVFIVTKDGVTSPKLFYDKVCKRLETLQADTIDMMFIHGIDDPSLPRDFWGGWRRLKDRLVRENKVRFMGFSTHADMPARVQCVANAARSPWVDALLVACDPLLLRTHDDLNRALDACVKAKLGLLAMKTTRSLGRKAAERRKLPEGRAETEMMPGFDALGLSAFGAVHYGMWSDGRFAAVVSAMLDRAKIDENTRNARAFRQPLTPEQWEALEQGMRKLARATCPGCDGACRLAAGTDTDFAAIARYLAYAEQDGNRAVARNLYRSLPRPCREGRDADLDAASQACTAKLDFRAILSRAQRLLA
jgi:hypothetical protein